MLLCKHFSDHVKKRCFLILQGSVLTHVRWSETFWYPEVRNSLLGTVVPPTRNQNSCFCTSCHLSITDSWFQRKDIHRFSWASNNGHTWKEIDQILLSQGSMARQYRVYCSFHIDSDQFPVTATLKVMKARPYQNTRFIQAHVQAHRPNGW